MEVRLASVSTLYPAQTFTLLNASGYVVAQRKAAIGSKLTSRLTYLAVGEGDRVKADQVVARLENADVVAARERAKAAIEVARTTLEQAQVERREATRTNVELPLLLSGLSRRRRREHVAMALGLVCLEDRMDHYPSQLSGGQQQRVAIARAVVADPTILVADEPTGDLDRVSAEEVMNLLARLNRYLGKTIIMVTHDPRAGQRAHKTVHLDKGVLNGVDQNSLL